MEKLRRALTVFGTIIMLSVVAFATFNYFQGFEINSGDWTASQGITRVPSGGGTLHLTASSGSYYAELQNLHDGYQTGFGDGGFSFYNGADPVYHGDFFQAIDVYIDANWAPAATSDPSFWIDMTPYHADPNNFGAEHNFRIKALGSSVLVTVDGQTNPIATLAASGWYTFLMSWEKAPNPADPVITHMTVYDSSHNPVGTTQVIANSPGGPFASSDLGGTGTSGLRSGRTVLLATCLALTISARGCCHFGQFPTTRINARMAVGSPCLEETTLLSRTRVIAFNT